jgi:hypothetical protein
MTIASLAAVALLWFSLTAPQDDPLLRQLGDDDPEKRDAAYTELIKRGDAARPILEKALASKNPDVSGRAAKALRAIDRHNDLKARDAWKEAAARAVGKTHEEITVDLEKRRRTPLFDAESWGDQVADHRLYYLDDAWQLNVQFNGKTALTAVIYGIADEEIDEDLYGAVKAIHNSPRVYGGAFNPLGLIRAVNTLHPLGKERAIDALRAYFQLSRRRHDHLFDEQRIFLIVRVLFDGEMPRMNIGGPDADETGWPLFPITVVDDVPFMVCNGYSLTGKAEPASSHIDYVEKSCSFRAKPLAPTSSPAVAAAKLLTAHPEIKAYHRRQIQEQSMRAVQPVGVEFSEEIWKKFAEAPQPTWDGTKFSK